MSGAESNMRQRVNLALRAFDPISVENPAHPGTPDVNCSLGWLELKVLDEWPVRASTPVRIKHYTPQQRVWLLRRWRCDQRAWLLLKVDNTWLLFDGETAAKRVGVDATRSDLLSLAIGAWFPRLDDVALIDRLRS